MTARRADPEEVRALRAAIADDLAALMQAVRRPAAGAREAADVSEQLGRLLTGRAGWAAAAAGVLAGLALAVWSRLRQARR
ncbi:MAG: hypothetical protein QN141_06525 [Armatimonadota bacterium]|nr:hypothetical protein [Armatimonadota bacterium]MDR7452367.1 hypothetical protein [Armatimonadota bacterium]MDR7466927.1 hypothetical protein [Armatimonadota bacterium]MDR7493531.1 hypothetical protein [Armatimonadota bacterium]MDR7498796.1 hypothetical protein [Armatimonadota bacterium]